MPVLLGTSQPTADGMWEALRTFAEGGLYEAMLRDLPSRHPNHDWLCLPSDRVEIPAFCKTVLDNMVSEMIHDEWKNQGKFMSELCIHALIFYSGITHGAVQLSLEISGVFEPGNTKTSLTWIALQVKEGKHNGFGSYSEGENIPYSALNHCREQFNQYWNELERKLDTIFVGQQHIRALNFDI